MPAKTLRIPKTLFREATFDRSAVNEEDRTVELSISSDAPYERYFGFEILDHSEKCVNMERMNSGAPLLFNHDRDLHIGTIIEAKCEGKKLRVKAKIGENSDAQNRWADIKSGVLQKASVGYSVDAMVLEDEKKDGPSTYRVTSWTPFEGSLVTIPADFSVGVGRSDERSGEKDILCALTINVDEQPNIVQKATQQTRTMPEAITTPAVTIDPASERNAAVAEFKTRCKRIDDFVGSLKNPQWQKAATEIAAKHKTGEADFDAFRAEALDSFEGVTRIAAADPGIGMTAKEKNKFSLMRAIRTLASKQPLDGLEKEVSDAAAKAARMAARPDAIYLPQDITAHDLRDNPTFDERAFGQFVRDINVTTATAGGFTVPTMLGSLIELLRNQTVLGNAGITTIGGLLGEIAFPVQTGGATAYWVSESGALTDSAATFAQKSMTPHRLGATIPFTTQFLAQTSLSAEQFVRNELMTVTGIALDLAGLEGTGAAGQPLGVKGTTGINATVTFGGAATWADIVQFETGITTDNADIGSMSFIVSSATVGKWKTILKDSVAGADYLINSNNGQANGYQVLRTNQVTGDIAFFGVWSQLLHAMWSTQEIIVDPYALKKSGGIEVTLNSFHDFLVRQPLAFNVSTDSAAQ